MAPLIGLFISLIVLSLAYLIKHFLAEVIEDEHHFLMLLGVFFAIYISAAVALHFFLPTLSTVRTVSAEVEPAPISEVPVRIDSP